MKKTLLLFYLFTCLNNAIAQSDPVLKDKPGSTGHSQKVSGAFNSTRVINAHSTEMLEKGNLDFRVLHRFGFISDGIKQFFGLDAASFRMSFDYGITDNLTVGIGRSTFRKEVDAFVKARLFQQTVSTKPFSLLLAGGYVIHTDESFAPKKPSLADRSAYYLQLIAGRKFNSRFSMQLSPILVHTNIPFPITDDRKIFALGGGAKYKLSKRTALTLDYHHPFGTLAENYTDPLSIGVDIATGGHVFQLHFSNATGMNERAYITQTTGRFFKGNMRFGFNLSRIFRISNRRK
ncbi:MAG: DUF5777 family beta-barrel protein [Ferruginibacter sp.]